MAARLRGARPPRRHGPDLPRPGPQPAAATSGRAATTARRCPRSSPRSCPIVGRLARALPGGYRFTAAKDLADEIEWAKSRRITPATYAASHRRRRSPGRRRSRSSSSPACTPTTSGPRSGPAGSTSTTCSSGPSSCSRRDEAARDGRPVPQALDQRRRVPGHEPAPGAPARAVARRADRPVRRRRPGPDHLHVHRRDERLPAPGSRARHPGATVVALTENYRSTPQILRPRQPGDRPGRRLDGAPGDPDRRPAADRAPLPRRPRRGDRPGGRGEAPHRGRRRTGRDCRAHPGQRPARHDRGGASRPPACPTRCAASGSSSGARCATRSSSSAAARSASTGPALIEAVRALWATELGYGDDALLEGAEGRERAAALDTLLEIGGRARRYHARTSTPSGLLAELATRAKAERAGAVDGVNLLTYHRAKGLEWDAVFLPMLEEGSLPISHALGDPAALEEERRLLYVGITRARVHLALSWAETRANPNGSTGRRRAVAVPRGARAGRGAASATEDPPRDDPPRCLRRPAHAGG